jgi:hypothetical protein
MSLYYSNFAFIKLVSVEISDNSINLYFLRKQQTSHANIWLYLQNNLSLKSVQSVKQNLKVLNLIILFAADHERTNERLRKFSVRDVRFDLQHEREAERRLHLQPELKLEI